MSLNKQETCSCVGLV